MSQRVFDAQRELNNQMESLMDAAGAQGLCIPIAASYKALLNTVRAIAGPVTTFQADIIKQMDSASTAVFKDINNAIGVLNDVCASVPTLQITGQSLQALNIISRVCLDFNEILPNSMKNLIDTASGYANDLFGRVFDLPADIIDVIQDNILGAKDFAIQEALEPATNALFGALDRYRKFLKTSGITMIIDKLEKFERCMMNPQHCNRPRSEFIYPGTKKYNSQYYRDFFAINTKGELQLKNFVGDTKQLDAKINRMFRKLDDFRASPIKKSSM
jgi:hypothetical protein